MTDEPPAFHLGSLEVFEETVGDGVTLISLDPQVELAWGGTFDENFATDFAADNVGVSPLVLSESTDSTSLLFDVVLRSTPPNLAK